MSKGVIGLDFGAVILTATLTGAAGPLLAEVLRPVEILLLNAYANRRGDG